MNILPLLPDLDKKERRNFWLSFTFTAIISVMIYLAICVFT